MELRDLRAFVTVVDLAGMTRAAERLHVVQSAVSQAVRRLERELDLVLLERRPDGVRPTEAGEAMARHARVILNSVARAHDDMAAFHLLEKGRIQLGIVHTAVPLVLSPLMTKIAAAYPGLHLRVREGRLDELADLLVTRTLDLAVTFLPVDLPALDVHPMGRIELSIVVAANDELAGRKSVSMRTLKRAKWVSFPPDHPGREWLEVACADAGFAPADVIEVDTLAHLKTFVETAAGIALLPRQACGLEERLGTLVTIPLRPRRQADLAYVLDPHHPTGLVLDAVLPLLKETVAEIG